MTQKRKVRPAIHFYCFKGIIIVLEMLVCGDDLIAEDSFQQFEPKFYNFQKFYAIKNCLFLLCGIDDFIGPL